MLASLWLGSLSPARAGDQASFSPELMNAPAAVAAPAPVAEAAPAPRGKASKRRTRVSRARHRSRPTELAATEPAEPAAAVARGDAKTLTIGSIPAPLPPGHDDGKVADAVATLEAPPPAPSGNTEPASRTAGPGATPSAGLREMGSETVAALLAKHALENGVPVALARAVVRIESRGNAHAQNHGALGLMQIKYGTARAVGFAGPAVALLVADTNLRYGMKVLAQAWRDAGGDLCGALMRYQSGHLARHASAANRAYCSRARAFMAST